ncbi:MAG: SPOR domain-containing protein [Bacteroidia bacterium]|nr:SPOR domain-containing protein [Bacteroidia bacterium]
MQKVDKHISSLLYEHDCVIVPNLGGFVANYAPAKIHPTQHTFTPPSKNIVFNKNLKNNDGLLANHITLSEGINYPNALQHIQHFVGDVNAELKKGSKVKIDEVGTLFLDVERNVQFEPSTTNFLLDAFGLADLHSPAIKRENLGKRIEKEFKDRGAIPAEKKKVNIKRIVALTVAIPVLAAMIWIPLKTDLLKNVNYSNLNPFASKNTVKELPVSTDHSVAISKDTTSIPATIVTTNEPVTASLVEPVKADTTAVITQEVISANSFKFHVVAGCFKIESNAINFVKQLQSENINASIIGQNAEGLFVVSCGDYATRKQATESLQAIRSTQPNAWLYKN